MTETAPRFCHEHPDTWIVEAEVIDTHPGRVILARSPFYPRQRRGASRDRLRIQQGPHNRRVRIGLVGPPPAS